MRTAVQTAMHTDGATRTAMQATAAAVIPNGLAMGTAVQSAMHTDGAMQTAMQAAAETEFASTHPSDAHSPNAFQQIHRIRAQNNFAMALRANRVDTE